MPNNPIQYTSRDFQSILNDINADATLTDKPSWFKRLIAGVGDVFSMWLNASANDGFLRTSFTRQSVADLCGLIGYSLLPHTTSSGALLFYVDTSLGTGIFPFSVSYLNLRAKSQGSLTLSSKTFQARINKTFSLVQAAFTTNYVANALLTLATDLQYTGHKVRLSTSGTLPAPFQAGVDYYVIYVSATTIKLARSLADAYAGNVIAPTSDGSGTHTLTLYSAAATAYQQDALTANVVVGRSDGITQLQEFVLPDQFVLPATLTVLINSLTWAMVSDFTDSTPTSKHFKLIQLSENQYSIRFGNGTFGAIPPSGYDIETLYAFGGGADSNVNVIGGINSYAGNDTHLTGASNSTIFNGGADRQSIDDAKNVAPLSLKVKDRFITVQDGVTLALGYGGLSLVVINRNVYGALSCQVAAVAIGGGNPTASLQSAIQQFLIDRSILGSMDVRFQNATITPENVTSGMKVRPSYTFADLLPYFRLAWKLLLGETGAQIAASFTANGIAATVTLINSLFGENFGVTDYNQISLFLSNFTPRNFADTIQQATIIAFIQGFLIGCDSITIAAPAFPIILASTEITTYGTLTLTENT